METIRQQWHPGRVKITRYGHAALLVETDTARIVIDPGGFCDDAVFELTDVGAVVVTHQHPDHLDQNRIAGLLDANPGAVLRCDPETAEILDGWTANADGLDTVIGDLTITGVGSTHAEIVPQVPRIANVGVTISDGETTLFHPGDTYEYAPDGVDVLAVPLGTPWAKLSETVDFVQRVRPSIVIPIHDLTIAEVAYGMYWGRVVELGGELEGRQLGQHDSTEV